MKNWKPIGMLLLGCFIFANCKKDSDDQQNYNLFTKFTALPDSLKVTYMQNWKADALLIRVFEDKRYRIVTPTSLEIIEELDSFPVYGYFQVMGDRLWLSTKPHGDAFLIEFDLVSRQVISQIASPTARPDWVYETANGDLYVVANDDVGIGNRSSDIYHKKAGSDIWQDYSITSSNGGLIQVGGVVIDVAGDANGQFWMSAGENGLATIIDDSLITYDYPNDPDLLFLELALDANQNILVKTDKYPLHFKNGGFTTIAPTHPEFEDPHGAVGCSVRGSEGLLFYEDFVTVINMANYSVTHLDYETLLGTDDYRFIQLGHADLAGRVWIYSTGLGLLYAEDF